MATDSTHGMQLISRRHCYLLLTGAGLTYLLITMGGIVCVTASGKGCPDWPGCYGGIVPPMQMTAIIEYLHRFIAALTSPFIIGAAIVSWRKSRSIRWVSWPSALAMVLLLAVIVFGAVAVLRGLPPGLAAVDVGSALLVLALMLTASVVALARLAHPALPDRLSYRSSFARLTLWPLGAMFCILVTGVFVAGNGSLTRCLGGPLFGAKLLLADGYGWLQDVRRFIAGAASLLILAVVVQAWRTQRRQAAILGVATLAGVLLLVEITGGVLMLTAGFTVFLLIISVAATVALWALLVVLVVLAGLTPFTLGEESLQAVHLAAKAVEARGG